LPLLASPTLMTTGSSHRQHSAGIVNPYLQAYILSDCPPHDITTTTHTHRPYLGNQHHTRSSPRPTNTIQSPIPNSSPSETGERIMSPFHIATIRVRFPPSSAFLGEPDCAMCYLFLRLLVSFSMSAVPTLFSNDPSGKQEMEDVDNIAFALRDGTRSMMKYTLFSFFIDNFWREYE
jgi:hypothetical protein